MPGVAQGALQRSRCVQDGVSLSAAVVAVGEALGVGRTVRRSGRSIRRPSGASGLPPFKPEPEEVGLHARKHQHVTIVVGVTSPYRSGPSRNWARRQATLRRVLLGRQGTDCRHRAKWNSIIVAWVMSQPMRVAPSYRDALASPQSDRRFD
jgi:hypothetical protein